MNPQTSHAPKKKDGGLVSPNVYLQLHWVCFKVQPPNWGINVEPQDAGKKAFWEPDLVQKKAIKPERRGYTHTHTHMQNVNALRVCTHLKTECIYLCM